MTTQSTPANAELDAELAAIAHRTNNDSAQYSRPVRVGDTIELSARTGAPDADEEERHRVTGKVAHLTDSNRFGMSVHLEGREESLYFSDYDSFTILAPTPQTDTLRLLDIIAELRGKQAPARAG